MKKLAGLFDFLGKFLAYILVALYAVIAINATFNFIPADILRYLIPIKEWGALVIVAIVGLEAVAKRNIIIRVIFYVCAVVAVIFMFFPGVYENLVGFIK